MLNNTEVVENNMIHLYTNRKAVPHWIFKEVHEVVTDALPVLQTEHAYKLKSIFIKIDRKTWKGYAKYIKIFAGYCMSHLVATGQIKMEYVDKGSNSKRYRALK